MTTNMKEQLEDFKRLNDAAKKIKEELVSYNKPLLEKWIIDKSIPLEERWNLWKDSPEELKNECQWVEDFTISGRGISWYDDFYKERCETVYLSDLIHNMQRDFNEPVCLKKYTQADIDDFKEQILAKNLLSFVYDW